jgi:predicted RNase H-like nuclease (RuvC/YqgF family)
LIADPEGYYISKVLAPKKIQKLERKIENLTAQNTKLKMEVNELRNSTAFRIGRILTFIPGKIKRLFKRRRG